MSRFLTMLEDVEITRAKDVAKHGDHDQSEHGNWATGSSKDELGRATSMSNITSMWIGGTEAHPFPVYSEMRGAMRVLTTDDSYYPKDDSNARAEEVFNGTKKILTELIDAEPSEKVLYRGLAMDATVATLRSRDIKTLTTEGETFTENLSTWTSNSELADSFSRGLRGGTELRGEGAVGITMRVQGLPSIPITKYYPSDLLDASPVLKSADEHIASGVYKVLKVSKLLGGYNYDRFMVDVEWKALPYTGEQLSKKSYTTSGGLQVKKEQSLNQMQALAERMSLSILQKPEVAKHGDHDQSTHGSWAQGVLASAEVQMDGKKIGEIINRVKDEGGLTISMIDGSEPQTGFTFARGRKYSSIVDAQTFYKDEDVLASYYIKHKADLTGGKYHLGLWHNDADGQVYLDVSENIQDRERAISQGIKNDQISIWDVVNKKEIPTGGSGAVKEVRSNRDTRYVKDDRRGDSGLRQRDLGEVGKTLKVIYFDYGLKPVFKHGEHDQSEHGNWARGYTAEEIARVEEMRDKGPSVDDLDSAIKESGEYTQTDEQLKLIVENDSDFYREATKDIDEKVAERLQKLQEEFPNHEYTEQEKSTIYEDVQNEMVDEYVSENKEMITELAAGMDSGEFGVSAQELIPFFDEVYGVNHTGDNFDGEERTISSQIYESQIGYRGDGSIIIDGSLTNENGDQVGFMQREFFKENGVWNVEHLALVIEEDDYKGTGFGKEIIQQSEAWYVAREFGYIQVSTAMDGARHWARAGYDFNPEYLRENARELITAANSRFEQGTPERVEFDGLMSRYLEGYTPSAFAVSSGVRDMKDEGFPLPADFANIGYTAGAKDWAGKNLMSSLTMKYVKVLTAEGQKLMDGPIDHDGDGMIYDGTSREKPAPSGGNK